MATTSESFLELLEKSKLLTPEQFVQAQSAAGETEDVRALAKALVQKELITRWQAAQLLAGRSTFFLGKYKLIDLLGRGGMGGVFLAQHTMMNRAVALKIIPRQLGRDPALLERFLTEARAIAALDHPNIVHAYNVDNEGDRYYLVMEFVEGQDLRQVVEAEGPLAFDKAVDYMRQAADGLAHAHGRNMIHCDVKPANLLVNRQGVVKILDLGMARLVGPDETGTGDQNDRVLGTVDYQAPEQALQSPDLDHRADIYSLGCTLYFLLTGRAPFPEGTIPERIMKHQTQEPQEIAELRPGTPADLIEICRKMMAKDPAKRYPTCEELGKVLAEWHAPPTQLKRAVALEESEAAEASTSSTVESGVVTDVPKRRRARPKSPLDSLVVFFSDRRRLMWAGGVGAAVILLLGIMLVWVVVSKSARHRREAAGTAQTDGAETDAARAAKDPDAAPAVSKAGPEPAGTRPAQPEAAPGQKPPATQPSQGKGPSDKAPKEPPGPSQPPKPVEKPPEKPPEPPKPVENPPAPAPPQADPFKDFPKMADLPDEQGELAKIHTAADAPWDLELLNGDKVLKGNRQFLPLERKDEGGKPTWPVRLSAPLADKEPTDVAKFWRDGESLHFQWLEGNPAATTNQLRLCILQVRAGNDSRPLPLLKPQQFEPLIINLDQAAPQKVALPWIPDSTRFRVQVTKLEGLKDYTANTTEPVAAGARTVFSFTRKDPRSKTEQTLPLTLTISFRVSGSTLNVDVKLPELKRMGPPYNGFKSWSMIFKSLSGLGVREKMDEQLQKAHKDLEHPERLPADKRQFLERAADAIAEQIWNIDFYKSANKVAKIHYRILAQVDEQQVEVGSTPGATEPGKKP